MFSFGTDDQRQIYTLDVHGYRTQTEIDVTNDGTNDRYSTMEYNAVGLLTSRIDYSTMAGTFGTKETYTYDDATRFITRMERDAGNNGSVERIEEYKYDALGKRTVTYIDNDGVEGWEIVERYTRDANGRIIRKDTFVESDKITQLTADSMAEVAADSYVEYTLNAQGWVTKEVNSNDGVTPTSIIYREFDPNGYTQWKREDTNASSKDKETYEASDIEVITEFKYDELGRPAYMWQDKNGNGIYDNGDQKNTYSYPSDILDIREERYTNRSPIDVYGFYDENGKRVIRFDDLNANGVVDDTDRITQYTFDPIWSNGIMQEIVRLRTPVIEEDIKTLTIDELIQGDIQKVMHYLFNSQGVSVLGADGSKSLSGGDATSIMFGGVNGNTVHTEDFTLWSEQQWGTSGKTKLAFVGENISLINMNVSYIQQANSTVILNKDVISKISQASETSSIRIQGNANDTVQFKDITADNQLTETTTVGTETYRQFQFSYDKDGDGENPAETYTLLIDTDINISYL